MREFILFITACVTIFFVDYQAQAGECGIVTDRKVLAARAYHGLLISYEDETGEYFLRNGKRCRLFTDAFLKKWKGEK